MSCSKPQITGAGDCGHLCFCVCKCKDGDEWKPKCPNQHVFRLNIQTTETVTDPDAENPADSLDSVLLSMHEVTTDRFIFKRPRIPNDANVGNVTIKTEKVLSELEGGCTNDLTQGPTGALEVRYISVTTDTDKLVYEWDGTQLCKTAGTGRITSITSRWSVTPAGGADLCCMPRKVVRRIWTGTETMSVQLNGMEDGDLGGVESKCGSTAIKEGSCACYNTWTRAHGASVFDTKTFGEYVDGFYLSASFVMQDIYEPPLTTNGPCGEVPGPITPCFHSCDAISNLITGPIRVDFGPDDDCRSRQPHLLFNRKCDECKCEKITTPNKLEAPVNYTHLTDCCEQGGMDYAMCPDTGEGWNDHCCSTIFSYIGCKCADIPTTLATCDVDFPFPTCPIQASEWGGAGRTVVLICQSCACTGGRIEAWE